MADPSRLDSWKMFDKISPTYDKANRILSFGLDQGWRRAVFRFLPKRPQLRLLDLATGTGDQLIALFESGAPIAAATGIDLAAEMLEIAKKKVDGKAYWSKIEWLRADAEALPFQEKSFDAATFSFGIRNVPDPIKSLREIERVLKPQGRCLILEFSLPPQPIRAVYLLYLRHLLPRIGGYVSKIPDAYRYLDKTIEAFPSGAAFCACLENAGFLRVQAHRMAFGAVTLYVGEKR